MSRLYDRIHRYGTHSLLTGGERPGIRGLLDRATVVSTDNIMDLVFRGDSGRDAGQWCLTRDVPNLAPPMAELFLEGRLPKRMSPGWERNFNSLRVQVQSVGLLLSATDFGDDHAAADRFFEHASGPAGKGVRTPEEPGNDQPMQLGGKVRWVMEGCIYIELSGHRRPLEGCSWMHAAVGPDGAPPKLLGGRPALLFGTDAALEEHLQQMAWLMHSLTLPLFLAITFMHCHNVPLLARDPPRKLQRKHRKATSGDLTRYHVLDIDHARHVLSTEGRADEVGLRRALHIARGHFRTYTPERGGPFGRRITQPVTVWIPQHARGKATAGRVEKDYSVSALAPQPTNETREQIQ